MRHIGYQDFAGKKILVFGCGKVGRGVVFYAGNAGADVIAVDDPAAVVRHPGGRLLDRSRRAEVLEELSGAWCVVSATGKALALADGEYLEILRNGSQIMVNMGVEDEWGPGIPAERVLNRKAPLNFILPEPTLLKYIAPTMALHNHAAVELISSQRMPGIRKPSPAAEKMYWEITEKYGIISQELSAAGL
jgi:adenosylhomocysteinase